MKLIDANPRKGEYEDYITTHISNVQRAWRECLRDKAPEDIRHSVDNLIDNHDASKFSDEEWNAYLNYFYPVEGADNDKEAIDKAFDYAWNHHQKVNPHHWQYWVLVKDEGSLVALDMPLKHILCMLADWHSFYYVNPERSTQQWYLENGPKMTLSPQTRQVVEEYLEYLH